MHLRVTAKTTFVHRRSQSLVVPLAHLARQSTRNNLGRDLSEQDMV
jgi:hypothetical protein